MCTLTNVSREKRTAIIIGSQDRRIYLGTPLYLLLTSLECEQILPRKNVYYTSCAFVEEEKVKTYEITWQMPLIGADENNKRRFTKWDLVVLVHQYQNERCLIKLRSSDCCHGEQCNKHLVSYSNIVIKFFAGPVITMLFLAQAIAVTSCRLGEMSWTSNRWCALQTWRVVQAAQLIWTG